MKNLGKVSVAKIFFFSSILCPSSYTSRMAPGPVGWPSYHPTLRYIPAYSSMMKGIVQDINDRLDVDSLSETNLTLPGQIKPRLTLA